MRSRLEKSWRAHLEAPLSMSLVWCWHGRILTSIRRHPFLDSGSMSIEDTDYKWKSKGTGSKVVVRRHCS